MTKNAFYNGLNITVISELRPETVDKVIDELYFLQDGLLTIRSRVAEDADRKRFSEKVVKFMESNSEIGIRLISAETPRVRNFAIVFSFQLVFIVD